MSILVLGAPGFLRSFWTYGTSVPWEGGQGRDLSLLEEDEKDSMKRVEANIKPFKISEVQEAQQRVVEVIRSLEEAGTITLGKGGKDAEMVS